MLTEKMLSGMRTVRGRSDAFLSESQRLSPKNGAIAVGMGHNEAFIKGEALAVFLRELSRGETPSAALEKARSEGRVMVALANSRRPREYQVHLPATLANGVLDFAYQTVTR